MAVAAAVAVAAAGNARADDLALPLGAPVLPIPTPPALPSIPPLPIPTPPPLPSVPSVPIPKPPALPAVPAPAAPQGGRVPVPVAVPRHAAARDTAPAASPAGGGASGTSVSRRGASSASSASRTGSGSSGSAASRRAASSAPSASGPRGRARRREPSPRRLRRVLAPLAACVATLGPRQERVLVRRAGLRGFKGASRAETAASLHLTVRRVARLEHRALRTLRRKARAGACDAPGPATAVAGTRVSLPLPAPAAPTAPAPRQEVKAVQESGGGSVDVVAESAPKLRNVAPVAGAEAAVRAGRSYADEHPFQFALAVLVILVCALLFVRELRRA
jgi:Sigma-70, region 4